MDAVELPYPVDVATPGAAAAAAAVAPVTFRRARVTVKEVDSAPESNGVSVLVNSSIDRCTTLLTQKDKTSAVYASESASWGKAADSDIYSRDSQLPGCRGKDVSRLPHSRDAEYLLSTSQPGGVQLQRKPGKVSRSSNGCAKRPRIALLEDNLSSARDNDVKDTTNKPGSYPTKCSFPEKTQLVKQKNFSGKRGDKRNSKVPMKNRFDSVSIKGGSASFSSASGGNNFFGIHGLKSDSHDVANLLDEFSLNELLDGTFECPQLAKDKGKKVTNMSENILDPIRKACSILPDTRPVQSLNIAGTDSSSIRKMSTCPISSVSIASSGVNGDKEDPGIPDPSSSNKDSCSNPETPSIPLEFPLYKPKYILERLALPPPKDLDSLLLDVGKSTVSSKNNSDLRSSKQISRRASLPPFPWSHTSNGHCKANSDAVKLLASRSTCQGRWVKIGSITSVLGTATGGFTDLESFTYDQSLVPSGESKPRSLENKFGPFKSVIHSCCEQDSSSLAIGCKASRVPLDSGGDLKHQVKAPHCPRVLAAAQILYDIANHSPRQNRNGMMSWSNKASQKVAKARKLKSIQKPEEIYPVTSSGSGYDNPVRRSNHIMASKRPKLSPVEDKKETNHTNCVKKGPINLSAPRSSRPSPSKSVRASITESIHLTTNITNQSYMLPPLPRVLDRASSGQQKARKVLPLE